MTRTVRGIAVAILLFACSSGEPGAGPTTCAAGEVLVEGDCRALCRADSDCNDGQICRTDVYVLGARTTNPTITGIDGDGTAVGDLISILSYALEATRGELSAGWAQWPNLNRSALSRAATSLLRASFQL